MKTSQTLTLALITKQVASASGVVGVRSRGKGRRPLSVWARQMELALCCEHTSFTEQEIAVYFKRKSRGCVTRAVAAVRRLFESGDALSRKRAQVYVRTSAAIQLRLEEPRTRTRKRW